MEEMLGLGELEESLYETWAAGGYGMIISGAQPLLDVPLFIDLVRI